MSNEEINKYKELYSQLISELVGLHNTHASFVRNVGRDTGNACRRHLRAISNIATELKKQGQKVGKESTENRRVEKKAAIAEQARLKAIPKRKGRPPKGNIK
jgi:hypothetical protein